MTYNILTTPYIELRDSGRKRLVTLPDLFSEWADGSAAALDMLRRHQRPAMHMFLVQLAAAALFRDENGRALAASSEIWAERLLRLAPEAAWNLVADSDAVAALLQPPLPAGDADRFKPVTCPDDLTILVQSKNHALKQSRIAEASPWTWLAALVELQTMVGYSGRGNTGIVRMNGGSGSRPLVAVYPDMADGPRWVRDVEALIENEQRLRETTEFFAPLGTGLVAMWLRPWDGEEQLELSELDPLCIEVARRIRLRQTSGRLSAVIGNTANKRVGGAEALNGRLGDPWTPVNVQEEKSLTVNSVGWSLRLLRNLLIGGEQCPLAPSLLQEPRRCEKGGLFFHAAVLAGGQGKTEGFHEVTIPIPAKAIPSLFGSPDARARLGRVAMAMQEDADFTAWALRRAALLFAQGGPQLDSINSDRKEADAIVDSFRRRVADRFFEHLWDADDADGDRSNWRSSLTEWAKEFFDKAVDTLPVRSQAYWKAEARGRSLLIGTITSKFNPANDGNAAKESP